LNAQRSATETHASIMASTAPTMQGWADAVWSQAGALQAVNQAFKDLSALTPEQIIAIVGMLTGATFNKPGGSTLSDVVVIGGQLAGQRASGGAVMPGLSYLVGEGGRPEVFTPSVAGYVAPISGGQSAIGAPDYDRLVSAMAGALSGVTVQMDGREVGRLVSPHIGADVFLRARGA
jgi:hypothetical protein